MGRGPEHEEAGTPFEAWVDAQLPPALVAWLREEHSVSASHVEAFGLLGASDQEIFAAAAESRQLVVIVTKDSDFATLVARRGAPPRVVWLRCGNVTNTELRRILGRPGHVRPSSFGEAKPWSRFGVAGTWPANKELLLSA